MVRTDEAEILELVKEKSQSPQSGAMVRTHALFDYTDVPHEVSIPSKRGNGSDFLMAVFG